MEAARLEPIRGVIFDFGNVIYRFDNRRMLAGLSRLCGRPPEELAAGLGASTLSEDYESGRLDSRAFLAGVSELCGCPLEESAFLPVFTDIFTSIESTLELIRRLAPNYRLGLISNTNPWHFESTIRPCEVFPLFQAVTLSHELKAMKPDPRLYLDCIRRLGLPAGACVFIDDRPEFVEGAARVGMGGITYTGAESLRAALEALGVRA